MRCTLIFPASLISIHALREEGDVHQRRFCANQAGISIHALREEGDTAAITTADSSATFLSTPSARRATTNTKECGDTLAISIHALREEGDVNNVSVFCSIVDFYPRPPRGGRRSCHALFLAASAISIHALREEGDFILYSAQHSWYPFLSTPSARRATDYVCARACQYKIFLSTPSARRATQRR